MSTILELLITLCHKSSTAALKRQQPYSEMEIQLLQSKLFSAWKYSDTSLKFFIPHNQNQNNASK